MSHALYRLGRYAARRPWRVIGAWLVMAFVVVGASATFGRELEDSFDAPGLDSSKALDLLTSAQSESAGPTAQVVLTPRASGATFFDSATARSELAKVQATLSTLPNVLGTSDPTGDLTSGAETATGSGSISSDGRVAVVRVHYALLDQLSVKDLDNLKRAADDLRRSSLLRIELGGDLFFSFESDGSGSGEVYGLVAAVVILLLAFGSLIAMGLPIGLAGFGLALGVSSMSLITYLIDIPSWAPQIASMVGLGVGIDYSLFLVTRHREFLARGMTVEESVGRSVDRNRRPSGHLRRRHRHDRDPRSGGGRNSVPDCCGCGNRGDSASDGHRVRDPSARVPGSRRAPGQRIVVLAPPDGQTRWCKRPMGALGNPRRDQRMALCRGNNSSSPCRHRTGALPSSRFPR